MLWHAESLVLVPTVAGAVATGNVSYERGPRGPAGFRRVERRGGSAMRKLLIWVAALLLVDFDDLVGRGICWPRRRDKETAKHVRGARTRAVC